MGNDNMSLDCAKYEIAEAKKLPPIINGLEYPMVVVRTKEMKEKVSLNNLVNHIIDKYANDISTTVIYKEIEDLTEENGKKKIMDLQVVQGYEDEFIIYSIFGSAGLQNNLLDALTRARNGFVVVIDSDSG